MTIQMRAVGFSISLGIGIFISTFLGVSPSGAVVLYVGMLAGAALWHFSWSKA